MPMGPFGAIYTVEMIYTNPERPDESHHVTIDGRAQKGVPFMPDGEEIREFALSQLVTYDMPMWERDQLEVTGFWWTDMNPVYDHEVIKKLEELDQ